MTLGKHWNPFSVRAPPRTSLGSSRLSPRLRSRLGRRKPLPHFPPLDAFNVFGSAPWAPRTSTPSASPLPHSALAPSCAFWISACQQLLIFWTTNAPERRFLHYKYNFSRDSRPRTPAAGGETPDHTHSCTPPPKAGAPPPLSGWLRPCAVPKKLGSRPDNIFSLSSPRVLLTYEFLGRPILMWVWH